MHVGASQWRSHQRSQRSLVVALLPYGSISLAAIIIGHFWPERVPPISPAGGLWVLVAITLGVAALTYWLRHNYRLDGGTVRDLPDPLYTLYLAMIILVGLHQAVMLAAITPLLESAPDYYRHPRRSIAAVRQSAVAATTTLVAGILNIWLTDFFAHFITVLRAHLVAAIFASAVMFLGVSVARALDRWGNLKHLRDIFRESTIRYQGLLLSIGPVLPLAELIDNVESEFAWILFLVPLCAVYYLAIVSARLQRRTEELQQTVGQLSKARKRELELVNYAALVTRAQEDERRRLARELHDDTSQTLIALARGLDTLASRRMNPPLSTVDERFIRELGEFAKRTLDSVRRACQDLRPSVLDDLGLSPALDSLASSTTQRGLPATYEQRGESRTCPPEVEVTVYRIAQEALSNARQHAKATSASMVLTYGEGTLELVVSDNGCGFDYPELLAKPPYLIRQEQKSGLGLLGMRERAALIGAKLAVDTSPGTGTTISLTVPRAATRSATTD